ncbi:hypothetical protein [Streptomyces sp. 7N604]|uniref:hypothetical protein n=1 Tax=Streptomyces sp. 7N604 TaxID=3457415 RepID=UPI003FCF2EA9
MYGDAQEYVSSARFNKPGTIPLTFQTEVKDGCPTDCGLCPEHEQHACLGIIEVNTGCNLDCPIRFADSGHQPGGTSRTESGGGCAITHEQCARMLDVFVESEGEAEVVMLLADAYEVRGDGVDYSAADTAGRTPPRAYLDAARAAVADGIIGYVPLVAAKSA